MIQGVDLSDYQTVESFHDVKNAGIGFVFAKATQGTGNTQQTFQENRDRCREVALLFGAYHFFEWGVDAKQQAAHFLDVYKPQTGDLPPVLDLEGSPGQSVPMNIMQVSTFLGQVQEALDGQKMLLYMSYSFPGGCLAGGSGFAGHNLWVAAYETVTTAADVTPDAWTHNTGRVLFQQYSETGTVPGISGQVDLDVFFGEQADLEALTLKM